MSLNYDLSALPPEVAFKGDEIDPITDAIIWYAMFTGMPGELTEKTLPEFIARVQLMEALTGPMLRDGEGKPHPLTPEEIMARKGLKTGVTNIGLRHIARGESRAQWLKRFIGGRLDDFYRPASAMVKAEARRERAKKAEAEAAAKKKGGAK